MEKLKTSLKKEAGTLLFIVKQSLSKVPLAVSEGFEALTEMMILGLFWIIGLFIIAAGIYAAFEYGPMLHLSLTNILLILIFLVLILR